MVKKYCGWRVLAPGQSSADTASDVSVSVVHGDKVRDLPPRHEVRNHSPTGFSWGYAGSGPAQLALAICCDAVGVEIGERVYQEFKDAYVANWGDRWEITAEEVAEFCKRAMNHES